MPSITHDGRSLLLDGRRLWIASGALAYARLPRDTWRDRVHAAKLAGLNCIDVPLFWNCHEQRPGKFDFKGDNDLRHLIEIIKRENLYALLRLGPYVGDEWDMGGLPAWLLENPNVKLRTANGPFLEASSRFISAVADQVKDLQVTSPGQGGPIVALQIESSWTCGKDQLAHDYLGELSRYAREAGLNVPCINNNNLWQAVEGEIDGWVGSEDMLATMRQLGFVKPDQPRFVIGFRVGRERIWGEPEPTPLSPWEIQRRLAEILVGGGQFNIRPFAGGTNHAFWGGRSAEGWGRFFTTSADAGALVKEDGSPAPAYHAVRRIAHLSSRFGRVFSHLDPAHLPVVLDPGAPSTDGNPTVVPAAGSQGGIVFVFSPPTETAKPKRAKKTKGALPPPPPTRTFSLLMPDGSSLPVTLGEQSVAWCVFRVHVSGRSIIDYCNLNAFATFGQTFVCFGPAGARAMLSVNGSPVELTVPEGRTPLVITHEGLTVVIVSEQLIDHTFVTDHGVFAGVQSISADGIAIPLPGEKHYTHVDADGKMSQVPVAPEKNSKSEKITLGTWTLADCDDYLAGTSPRYATINAPTELTHLGSPFGYGWYRIQLKNSSTRKAKLLFPEAADRLHVFADGKEVGVVGAGPGASHDLSFPVKKGDQNMVVLAENMGRFSSGVHLADRKGLYGHAHEYAPLNVAKPKLVRGTPIDVLAAMSPLWDTREGETTLPDRVTWSLSSRKKSPLIVRFTNFPGRALLVLNDEILGYADRAGPRAIIIDSERISKGTTFQIAMLAENALKVALEDVAAAVEFFEASSTFTEKADFAFAKWEMPQNTAFGPMKSATKGADGPAWYRCTFKVGTSHAPLHLDPAGLTKGQIYLNGRHVGRYFVATPSSAGLKPVEPQSLYLLPDAWLKHGLENEITLFEEHGSSPAKARLIYASPESPIRS
ncbi:MAG: beta-galactosidase [Phycisphaerales bacterium]